MSDSPRLTRKRWWWGFKLTGEHKGIVFFVYNNHFILRSRESRRLCSGVIIVYSTMPLRVMKGAATQPLMVELEATLTVRVNALSEWILMVVSVFLPIKINVEKKITDGCFCLN